MVNRNGERKQDKQNANTASLFQQIVVGVVVLLFYVNGKYLRSCRDGQVT